MVDFSLIIPIFNIESKLRRCIDSLLCQSWDSYEIILVNDASTDGSGRICREYSDLNAKCKVVNHELNIGLPSARNSGVRFATGRYIWHIDGDDYVSDSRALEKIIRRLTDDGTIIAVFGLYLLTTDGKKAKNLFDDGIYDPSFILAKAGGNSIFTYVYSRELCTKLEVYSLEGVNIGEDQILVSKLLRCAASVSTFKECFYVYDMTASSIMRKRWSIWQYMQDRLYLLCFKDLYKDRSLVLQKLLSVRNGYVKSNLLKRAISDLNRYQYDMYDYAVYSDTQGHGAEPALVSVKHVDFSESHFMELLENVKFVIHVGCHKTATTAIQSILHLAKNDLSLQGVVYIDLDDFRSRVTTKLGELTESQVRSELLKLILSQTYAKINRVVISDENIIRKKGKNGAPCLKNSCDVQLLRNLIAALNGYRCELIVSIREYAPYLTSMHSEIARHRTYVSINELYPNLNLGTCSWTALH